MYRANPDVVNNTPNRPILEIGACLLKFPSSGNLPGCP